MSNNTTPSRRPAQSPAAHRTPTDETLFRRALDAFGQPVIITDADGTILYCNSAAADSFGWRGMAVVGGNILKFMPPAEPEKVVELIGQVASGATWSGEIVLARHNDGSTFPALLTNSPIFDEAGEVAQVIGIAADITGYRTVERLLRLGFESAPHGWAFTDLDGRITLANRKFCEIVDRDPEDVIGHIPHEFTSQSDASLQTPFAEMRNGDVRDSFETQKHYRRPDGTLRTVDLFVQLVRDETGEPVCFFGHIEDVTEWMAAQHEVAQTADAYQRLLHDVVGSIGTALELRDPYTAGHQHRVALLSSKIGRQLCMGRHAVEGLYLAASLHDIGKIATPAEILTKPSGLDPAELAVIRRHPAAGHDIIADINFPWPVATMILQHHERLDGSGYPFKLKGDQILLESRILAVADTVEAITAHRPYQPGRSIDTALSILTDDKGRRFDTEVVNACLDVFESGYELPSQDRSQSGSPKNGDA